MKNSSPRDYEILLFATPHDFESWLEKHHQTTHGIWMKIAKKSSGVTSVTYDEALEIALCYGWIDGQAKTIDDIYYMQKFTPRSKRSMWSKRNREIVMRLITERRMQEAGQFEIERAKADGRWDAAYDSPKNTVMPDAFLRELAKDKKAEAFFKSLNKTNTYAIAWRIQTAKKPETKARRIENIIQMLHEEKKFH